MRVLVISRNAWDDTNSIGNTLSNFFGGLESVEFANIYFRSSKPNNSICKRYYHATEKDILKHWFSPDKIGKAFVWDEKNGADVAERAEAKEKSLIRLIQKHNLKSMYRLSDFLWNSKKWINGNLDAFVSAFAPDVVFSFVKSSPQYFLTVQYLKEKFGIPLFTWIADDEYTGLYKNRQNKKIECLRYILKESAAVRGCSEEICDYYHSVFGCRAVPLYKGCDLSASLKDKIDSPLKIVYAGNLQYGRMEIICKIAEILEHYEDISFDIYSNTQLSEDEQNRFRSKKHTAYLGKRDYSVIKERLAEADVVLHAESFDPEQILKTKYSFSTKIIDCLQSGSVLLAVGPGGISSIEYVKKIPGACVVENLERLEESVADFLADAESFRERALKIRDFARLHHDVENNSKETLEILKKIKSE